MQGYRCCSGYKSNCNGCSSSGSCDGCISGYTLLSSGSCLLDSLVPKATGGPSGIYDGSTTGDASTSSRSITGEDSTCSDSTTAAAISSCAANSQNFDSTGTILTRTKTACELAAAALACYPDNCCADPAMSETIALLVNGVRTCMGERNVRGGRCDRGSDFNCCAADMLNQAPLVVGLIVSFIVLIAMAIVIHVCKKRRGGRARAHLAQPRAAALPAQPQLQHVELQPTLTSMGADPRGWRNPKDAAPGVGREESWNLGLAMAQGMTNPLASAGVGETQEFANPVLARPLASIAPIMPPTMAPIMPPTMSPINTTPTKAKGSLQKQLSLRDPGANDEQEVDIDDDTVAATTDPLEAITRARTEDGLLKAFDTVRESSISGGGGATLSVARVASVAGAKRLQDPAIWTARVAQAFGQLLQDVKHGAGSGEGKA